MGELGLDYDRFNYSPKCDQKKAFEAQLKIAAEVAPNVPLFLHSRTSEASVDLLEMLRAVEAQYNVKFKGVIHSFTGTREILDRFLNETQFYVSVNGAGLRQQEQIECAKAIPLDRLLIESDCPYCDIRPTHDSYKYVSPEYKFFELLPTAKRPEQWKPGVLVRGRNEPLCTLSVASVIAAVRGINIDEVLKATTENFRNLLNQ